MLDEDEFGVSATYTPALGSPTSVVGIFDNSYQAVDIGSGAQIASEEPRFLCRTADVSSAAEGDTLVADGTTYTIRVVMSDGTGMTELVLEEQ